MSFRLGGDGARVTFSKPGGGVLQVRMGWSMDDLFKAGRGSGGDGARMTFSKPRGSVFRLGAWVTFSKPGGDGARMTFSKPRGGVLQVRRRWSMGDL